jgi:hypothetical protein
MWFTGILRDQFASPSGPFGSLVVAPLLNFTNTDLIRAGI